MEVKITHSSGNIWLDLGRPREEAENLKLRSNLMIEITKLIRGGHMTQARAARLFGVSQPRISDLTRGKIARFSVDGLVAMLSHAGMRVSIEVHPAQQVASSRAAAPLERRRRARTSRRLETRSA